MVYIPFFIWPMSCAVFFLCSSLFSLFLFHSPRLFLVFLVFASTCCTLGALVQYALFPNIPDREQPLLPNPPREVVSLVDKYARAVQAISPCVDAPFGQRCPICFETTNDHNGIMTPCLHSFHYDCLWEWFLLNPSCPICRLEF